MLNPDLAESLRRDERGRIVYTYRGRIERGVGGRYVWREGFSPTTLNGGILYPWMTRRECQRDARSMGSVATFEYPDAGK